MHETIVIRNTVESDRSDVEHVLAINNLSIEDIGPHFKHFFVAIVNGTIVGTAGLEAYTSTGFLRSVAVLPSHQDRGIGDKLVTEIEMYARKSGLRQLVLMTTTAARYFHRKGFEPTERELVDNDVRQSSQFTGACPSSAIAMKKNL